MTELDAIRDRLSEAAKKVERRNKWGRLEVLKAEAELAAASKAFDEWVRKVLIDAADETEERCLATSNLDYEAIADAILKREARKTMSNTGVDKP